MNESEAMAVLVCAQNISYAQREHALNRAGSARALLENPDACAKALGEAGLSALRKAQKGAQRTLDALHEAGITLIVRGGEGYPKQLACTAKAPHLLFCRGEGRLDDPFPLAIVGTRRADTYGMRHTRELARQLAEGGMCIVSGLALGVDTCAHKGALDAQGRTVAVLGGALDRLYPAENRYLMEQILERGGSVVSEYAPGTAPTRYSFVQRNRIIAGLALGVLVTQAPHRSGAQSTVQAALEEGREVFALPGDIDRMGSQLPNRLIAEGARPVTCAQDILGLLVIEPENRNGRTPDVPKPTKASGAQPAAEVQTQQKPQHAPPRPMDSAQRAVYDLLLTGEMDFDALCEGTGMASDALGSLLMMMELDGIVCALPGPAYRLA